MKPVIRKRRTPNRIYKMTPPAERFAAKFAKAGADECWLWTGNTNPQGRGIFYFDSTRKGMSAPRAALLLLGVPLAPHELACHTCDNPLCVNPAHLYVGSYSDNLNDAYARGQNTRESHSMKGIEHPQAKLNEDLVRAIRDEYARGGVTMLDLSQQFSVGTSTIHRIVHRRSWAHI